jgi:maltose alpha-D-glucosyltransferase/alpha-amylase
MAALPVLGASRFEALFEDSARTVLETAALPAFLVRQRWFGAKARGVGRVRLADGGPLQPPLTPFLAVADVEFADGGVERYALPLTVLAREHAEALLSRRPSAAVAWIDAEGSRLLVDALSDDDACRGLLAAIEARTRFVLVTGSVATERDAATVVQEPLAHMAVRRSGAEQSNSSVIFDRASILKVYRRLEPGPHPELELGRFLRRAGFTDVPAVLGSMEYTSDVGSCALAVLHALVPDAIDGWEHTLEHAGQYFARVAPMPVHQARAWMPPQRAHLGHSDSLEPAAREAFGVYLDAARTLGRQTAALHVTLSRGTDEGLAPEPMSAADMAALVESTRARARAALTLLAERLPSTGAGAERARALIAAQSRLFERCDALAGMQLDVMKTRCHQDYHLGQLLWTGARYALLDFEGEPARPLAERRRKRPPLTDVAGMLRSYSYAAWSGLFAWSRAHRADALEREPWATLWETAVSDAFLTTYLDATRGAAFMPPDDRQLWALLELLMIDKALYELDYELNNRPDWLPVPIEGLLRLLR